MGLYSWLASRYIRRDAKFLIETSKRLTASAQKEVARHLFGNMEKVASAERFGGTTVLMVASELNRQATRDRQMVVATKPAGFSDPAWLSASMVETWTAARIGAIKGKTSARAYDQIDSEMFTFITNTLAPNELAVEMRRRETKVFVNYRRDDAAGEATAIRDALASEFGQENVFMDVSTLVPGQKFDERLEKAVADCDVLLVVIGSKWLAILRGRQVGTTVDFVAEEIKIALKMNLPIIPVRVGREGQLPPLPNSRDLPEELRDLSRHHKQDVNHERFTRDIEDLAGAIKKLAIQNAEARIYAKPERFSFTDGGASSTPVHPIDFDARPTLVLGRANEYLKKLVAIETDVFRLSLGRALGLSKIDFEANCHGLAAIEADLAELVKAANRATFERHEVAALYIKRLGEAAAVLRGICAALAEKARSGRGPSWKEYNRMVEAYREAVKRYTALGGEMNELWKDKNVV